MAPPDPRDHLTELRRRLDMEKKRLAELRQQVERTTTRANALKAQMIRDRLTTAMQAEGVADQAEAFAEHLVSTATSQAGDDRLRLAERERHIAAIERRNAAKLREARAEALELESVPPLDDEADK